MLNLSSPVDREALAKLIQNDINEFCATHYESGHRKHLGASELGIECHRKLYYKFRWVKKEVFDGRKLRLFNVGHMAEPRFITYLRGIGFEVRELDENGKQFRISGAHGHYGGSLDGMCRAPAKYQISEDVVLSLEFKTNGTGTAYNKVSEVDLYKAKPTHWAQMCQYGYKTGLKYGIYLIENKNDSDITIKVIELDWNLGAQLEHKAEQIIFSKEPPNRISDNPAYYECKGCHFTDICHGSEKPEKNCRSCRNAMPTEASSWTCSRFGVIPEDFVPVGCNEWLEI